MKLLPALAALTSLALLACDPKPDSDSDPPGDSPVDSPVDTEDSHGDTRPVDTDTGPHDTDPDTGHTADTDHTGDTGEPRTMVERLDPYTVPPVRFSPDPLVDGAPVTITYEGSLVGSAKLLELRYGFNNSAPIWPQKMAATATGFELTMDVPKGNLALHVLFEDPETGDIDDGDEHYYHAATEFPYLGPWLTWSSTAQPGSGVVVSWETTTPCLGVVEYGVSDALGSWQAGSLEDTVHHVEITGLTPGDTLHYRVWDSTGRVSDGFAYAVPDTTAPFEFIAMSDLQPFSEGGRLGDTVTELLSGHPDAAFALVAGDIVGWDDPSAWWSMLYTTRDLWSAVPLVGVPGNHDSYGASTSLGGFDRYLAPPYPSISEPWYSIDFGSTHILSLHSSDSSSLMVGADQYSFVQTDLAGCWSGGVRVCDLVIASFHVPPYNVGTRHFFEQGGLRAVTSLFDGEVDWHIAGHEHLYQRFQPLRYEQTIASSGDYGVGADDGVGYIVLPTSGSTPGGGVINPADKAATVRDALAWPVLGDAELDTPAELGFVTFEVDGSDLTLTAWATGGWSKVEPTEVIETYTYTRP